MLTALLPLKDLVQAKSRLAGLLRPSERRALAQAMAEDVLQVLVGHGGIGRVVIVSDDPGARLLARNYGACCWTERELGCSGLNAVLQCAGERVHAEGAGRVLVLHADLPLICHNDLSAVVDAPENALVLGPDRHGTGTNLVAARATLVPRFQFGAGSYARYIASARRANVPVYPLCRPGIGLDVDEPCDLAALLDVLHDHSGGATAQLLHSEGLGSRVRRALAGTALGDERDFEHGGTGDGTC